MIGRLVALFLCLESTAAAQAVAGAVDVRVDDAVGHWVKGEEAPPVWNDRGRASAYAFRQDQQTVEVRTWVRQESQLLEISWEISGSGLTQAVDLLVEAGCEVAGSGLFTLAADVPEGSGAVENLELAGGVQPHQVPVPDGTVQGVSNEPSGAFTWWREGNQDVGGKRLSVVEEGVENARRQRRGIVAARLTAGGTPVLRGSFRVETANPVQSFIDGTRCLIGELWYTHPALGLFSPRADDPTWVFAPRLGWCRLTPTDTGLAVYSVDRGTWFLIPFDQWGWKAVLAVAGPTWTPADRTTPFAY